MERRKIAGVAALLVSGVAVGGIVASVATGNASTSVPAERVAVVEVESSSPAPSPTVSSSAPAPVAATSVAAPEPVEVATVPEPEPAPTTAKPDPEPSEAPVEVSTPQRQADTTEPGVTRAPSNNPPPPPPVGDGGISDPGPVTGG